MRGLFDKIKDTLFYYISNPNTRCDYDCREYKKVSGYVKNQTGYVIQMVNNSYVRPLMYEDDFENINETDYKQIGVDYIAVYKCKGSCSSYIKDNSYEIASYRRYDGQYFPTAKNYKSLFLIVDKSIFTM